MTDRQHEYWEAERRQEALERALDPELHGRKGRTKRDPGTTKEPRPGRGPDRGGEGVLAGPQGRFRPNRKIGGRHE